MSITHVMQDAKVGNIELVNDVVLFFFCFPKRLLSLYRSALPCQSKDEVKVLLSYASPGSPPQSKAPSGYCMSSLPETVE